MLSIEDCLLNIEEVLPIYNPQSSILIGEGHEMQEKTVVFLEETDPELLRAWHTFSDPVGAHPVTQEVWQYLGSEHDASGWRH